MIEIAPKIINKTYVPVLSNFMDNHETSFVPKNTAALVSTMNAKNMPSNTESVKIELQV
jgi:hypothetical protein